MPLRELSNSRIAYSLWVSFTALPSTEASPSSMFTAKLPVRIVDPAVFGSAHSSVAELFISVLPMPPGPLLSERACPPKLEDEVARRSPVTSMGRDLLSGLHLGCSYLIQLRQALSGSRDANVSASVTDKKSSAWVASVSTTNPARSCTRARASAMMARISSTEMSPRRTAQASEAVTREQVPRTLVR